jgi:hypothetical protein
MSRHDLLANVNEARSADALEALTPPYLMLCQFLLSKITNRDDREKLNELIVATDWPPLQRAFGQALTERRHR